MSSRKTRVKKLDFQAVVAATLPFSTARLVSKLQQFTVFARAGRRGVDRVIAREWKDRIHSHLRDKCGGTDPLRCSLAAEVGRALDALTACPPDRTAA